MTPTSPVGRRAALKAVAAAVGVLAVPACASGGSTDRVVRQARRASPSPSPTPPAVVPARFVMHAPRTSTEVGIGFHGGGERSITEAAMTVLERAGAPCTVFAIGTWLLAEPTLARRLLTGGHELGNHTHTHPRTSAVTREQLRLEVQRCRDVLVAQTGGPGVGLRPVESDIAVDKVRIAAAQAGYDLVAGFDVDPRDYDDPGADVVADRVLAQVRGGSMVFLHLGHQDTVDALPAILTGLAKRGLTPVTTSRLLRA